MNNWGLKRHLLPSWLNTWINKCNKHALIFGFCVLLSPTSLTAQPLNEWQDSKYILKAFKEIALKNEYQSTHQKILRWHQPIKYQFKYHALPHNEMVETLFNIQLQHLSNITSHPILKSSHKANLTIHLTKDEHYGSVIKRQTNSKVTNIEQLSHCMGSFKTNKNGEIIAAHIVIPVDHVFSKGLLVSCVIEESTQLMGLPNDSDWVHPTIANDKSKIEFLTGLDYVMLKLLYSKNIKAGMTGQALDKALQESIQKLRKRNQINTAQQQVNTEGLFPFVN